MKTLKSNSLVKQFIFLISLIFCVSLTLSNSVGNRYYDTIEKLVSKKDISVTFLATGAASYNTVNCVITNTTKDTLYVRIDAGRRLKSEELIKQDLIIVKEQKVELLPLENKTIPLVAYYCQKSKILPQKNDEYFLGDLAVKEWVDFAEFISSSDSISSQSIQQALYVLSENYSIASIAPDTLVGVKNMKRKLAEILQKDIPWYYVSYSNCEDLKPDKLWGTLYFSVRDTSVVTVQIKNLNGDTIQTAVENLIQYPGYNSYNVNLDVAPLKQGKYLIEIIEDTTQLRVRKRFEL